MVIESWLNEQADASQRGAVFGGYMAASYLGLVLGQMILVAHPQLGPELLMLVAFCFALCLVPLALTHKIHPAALRPAPLEPRFFIRRVPRSLTTVLVSGLVVGSFYGLAPLYANPVGVAQRAGRPVHGRLHLRRAAGAVAARLAVRPSRPRLADPRLRHPAVPVRLAAGIVATDAAGVAAGPGNRREHVAVHPLSAGSGLFQRPCGDRATGFADRHAAGDLRRRRLHRTAGGRRADAAVWR